jgi:demethylmenaquinone methyltransferase/2-methoxy-6-polyprenyl-1,4-benzoquinol methylase
MTLGLDVLWRRRAAALVPRASRILDLACGTGDFCRALRRRFPEAEIRGVDISEGMLGMARVKCPGAEFKAGDVMSAEWGAPDLVSCAFGFRNFPEKGAVLAKAASVLPNGGYLLVLELWRPASRVLGACVSAWLWIFSAIFARAERAEYEYLRRSIGATLGADEFIALAGREGFALRRRLGLLPSATALLFERVRH